VERVAGAIRRPVATALAFVLAAYALYWVVGVVAPQIYRPTFLLIALVITFLTFPPRDESTPTRFAAATDILLIVLACAALLWPVIDLDRFVYRAATPQPIDVVLGLVLIALVLEATRRTVGWILPVTAMVFLAYAGIGPYLDRVGLSMIAHRGYSLPRVVGTMYMTLEGILGVPLDVAATYIILFTVYGAVVEYSGAGRFFVDWAMAAIGRSRSSSAPARVSPMGRVSANGSKLRARASSYR